MRRLLTAAVMLACALGGAVSAGANTPGDGGPIDPPDLPDSYTYTLTVGTPSSGSITGTGIDCPGDCSESFTYELGQTAPVVTLNAARDGSGWDPDWSGGCTVVGKACEVTMSRDQTVSLDWRDVGDPSISWDNAPTRANASTRFPVDASDAQTRIVSVEFHLGGIVFEDRTFPYEFIPDEPDYFDEDGPYVVTARARDAGGNTAETTRHTFTFDSSGALASLTTNPPLTRCDNPFVDDPDCDRPLVATPPTFNWVRAHDTEAVFCLLDPMGSQFHPEGSFEDPTCTSETSDTPAIPADHSGAPSYDGVWRSVIFVRDDLNNIEEYVYEWTLDRRGPSIFLGAPQNDEVVKAPFTLSPTATDSRAGVAEVSCDPGTGSFGACFGSHDPPEGRRTVRVRAVDTLGNVRLLERSILYDKTAPQVQITEGPADGAFVDSGSVRFRFSASDAVGPMTIACKLDQGEFGACSGANSHSLDNLNPGIHRFTLRVVDAAGHETGVERLFVVPQPQSTNATTIINNSTTTTTPNTTPGTASGSVVGGTVGGQAETQPAQIAVASARVSRKFSVRSSRTTIRRLVLSKLAKGAEVQVKCKGRGCFRKAKKYKAKKSKLNLTRLFKKRKLAPRARIEIRISQRGRATRIFRYTTQKGKKQPKAQTLTV